MYKIICPLYVVFPRKTKEDRKCFINLNCYRNWKWIVSNLIKIRFKELLKGQIDKLPQFNKISLELILFKNSNRKIDRSNICCIVEKFLCDALVEFGKLEDDNDEFIIETKYKTGGVDKGNGRVEVIIYNNKEDLETCSNVTLEDLDFNI